MSPTESSPVTETAGGAIAEMVTSLKEMVTLYGVIADLFAFVVLVVAPISAVLPWWPDASIRIAVWLGLTLVALVVSFTRALTRERQLTTRLHETVRQLQTKLDDVPSRRSVLELKLNERLAQAVDTSDSLQSFLQVLREDVFRFLVEEFRFSRVALLHVTSAKSSDGGTPTTEFLFAHSALWIQQPNEYDDWDRHNCKITSERGDTLAKVSFEGSSRVSFVACYLPVADPTTVSDRYIFAFHLPGTIRDDAVQQEFEFIASGLAPKLQRSFSKLQELVEGKSLRKSVKHSHICAMLRLEPDGMARSEYLPDLSKSDLKRLNEVLSDEASKRALEQAFGFEPTQPPNPIVVSTGLYNLSLVPLLLGNSVHGVIAFLDEASGRPLETDQTRWHSLFGLSNYLYRQVGQDKLTGMANRRLVERQLEIALRNCGCGSMTAVILVGLRSRTDNWIMPTMQDRETLQKAGETLAEWVKHLRNPPGTCSSLAARWEGGIYMLLTSLTSSEMAYAQAAAIKQAVNRLQLTGDDKAPIDSRIGGVVLGNRGDISKLQVEEVVDKAFAALRSASNSPDGICITEV